MFGNVIGSSSGLHRLGSLISTPDMGIPESIQAIASERAASPRPKEPDRYPTRVNPGVNCVVPFTSDFVEFVEVFSVGWEFVEFEVVVGLNGWPEIPGTRESSNSRERTTGRQSSERIIFGPAEDPSAQRTRRPNHPRFRRASLEQPTTSICLSIPTREVRAFFPCIDSSTVGWRPRSFS